MISRSFDQLFLFYSICISLNCLYTESNTNAVKWTKSTSVIKELFETKIDDIAIRTTELCKLPLKIKLNICDRMLRYIVTRNPSTTIMSNNTASLLMNFDCIERPVTFYQHASYTQNMMVIQQSMLQCYSIHFPTKISWLQDIAFEQYYIVGGPYNDSYIIIRRELQPMEKDEFLAIIMVENLTSTSLISRSIIRNIVQMENISSEYIRRHKSMSENEIMYLHKYNRLKLEEYDPICNLKTSNKLLLCEKIMTINYALVKDWKLDKTAFNDDSSRCNRNRVIFKHKKNYNIIEKGFYQMMYPCYAKHTFNKKLADLLYISRGYHESIIIIYALDLIGDIPGYEIIDLIENIKLEDFSNIRDQQWDIF